MRPCLISVKNGSPPTKAKRVLPSSVLEDSRDQIAAGSFAASSLVTSGTVIVRLLKLKPGKHKLRAVLTSTAGSVLATTIAKVISRISGSRLWVAYSSGRQNG